MSLLSRHALVLALAGQPLPLSGRLLDDVTLRGTRAVIDPVTGQEVAVEAGTWVLSDEGEAADGNIVLGEWDLTRAARSNINVLYHHTQDPVLGALVLGRWVDFVQVTGLPDTVGRALCAKIEWANDLPPTALHIPGQVKQGMLRGASIGWLAGSMTPRGDLHPDDPRYREPQDDGCGLRMEGYVMGSKEAPNELVETSLTPIPSRATAYARARLQEGAQRAATALSRGEPVRPADMDRLLASLADHPRVRSFLDHREAQMEARLLLKLRATPPAPTPTPTPTPAPTPPDQRRWLRRP